MSDILVNIIAGGVLALVLGSAIFYIIRSKKNGVKCIGCPSGSSCSSKGNTNSCCSCSSCNGACSSCTDK